MSDEDLVNKPHPGGWDIAHTATKALLSAVPWVGGSVSEIFAAIITPPLTKRKDEWIISIAAGLTALEKTVEDFKIENLSQNNVFLTTVLHASQAAIRNHHQEKLKALRNSVLTAAVAPSQEDNLTLVFVRYIDELTPQHFRLLQFFSDNEQRLNHIQSYEELYKEVLTISPELTATRDEFKLLCADLTARNLLRISQDIEDFPGIYRAESLLLQSTDTSAPMLEVTSIGQAFLRLILEDVHISGDV